MRNLLSMNDLEREDVERICERAASFAEVARRDIKTVPTLRGRTIVNLFYESSTRTSSSFELAAKRLSADLISVKAAGSSVDKGESLKDTAARTLPYFKSKIIPDLKAGKNLLVSAHGNSLRSIVMQLDKLTPEQVVVLEIPTGVPIRYDFTPDGKVISKEILQPS